jgi:hypothetical protein
VSFARGFEGKRGGGWNIGDWANWCSAHPYEEVAYDVVKLEDF